MGKGTSMRSWSYFNLVLPVVALALFIAGGAFNAIVDPYNLTGWVTRPGLNEITQQVIYQSQLTKAVGLIRHHSQTVLFGSSIVDAGFDVPGSTLYDRFRVRNLRSARASSDIYNAGIRGAATEEALQYLRHAYLNN